MSIAAPSHIGSAELTPGSAASVDAQLTLQTIAGWLAVVVGFCIPVSTSLAEISVGLFVVVALSANPPRIKNILACRSMPLWISAGLFAALAVGIAWSTAGMSDGFRCLLKYREFLYLPLMAQVFSQSRWRQYGMWAFIAGCGFLLGMSYFEWLSGFDMGISQANLPNDHVISKDRIIHNLLMALCAYLCTLEFQRIVHRVRWGFLALMGLAVFNMVFLVQGRTGYLAFAVLLMMWLVQKLGRRGFAVGIAILTIGATTAVTVSPVVRSRFDLSWNQLKNQFGENRQHSADPRFEYYVNTIELIRQSPFMGTGTGSFRTEYDRHISGKDLIPVSEPHNEFLHLTIQIGIVGGLGYFLLLALQARTAFRLPWWERHVMLGVVAVIGLCSLFNSLILSVTGGLVWSYLTGLAAGCERSADFNPSTSDTLRDADRSPECI